MTDDSSSVAILNVFVIYSFDFFLALLLCDLGLCGEALSEDGHHWVSYLQINF